MNPENNQKPDFNQYSPQPQPQQPISQVQSNTFQPSQPNVSSSKQYNQVSQSPVQNQYNNQQPPNVRSSDTFQTLIPTKNKLALLAYYFGIFGLIPLLGIPLSIFAIIFGIMGLNKYKQNPTPGAKGHALAGIILGSIEISIFILLILFIVIAGINS